MLPRKCHRNTAEKVGSVFGKETLMAATKKMSDNLMEEEEVKDQDTTEKEKLKNKIKKRINVVVKIINLLYNKIINGFRS